MTVSSPLTLVFTAAATEDAMGAAETALQSAGFGSIRREIHPVPARANIPLAPPTVEVTTTRAMIANHLTELVHGLGAIRREVPDLGLMLVVDAAAGKSFYAWERRSSAQDVALGAAGLDRAPDAPGAYGWDTTTRKWTRV